MELIFVFGSQISGPKIFLKFIFVLDWNQGLTKLEFDTEDQVLSCFQSVRIWGRNISPFLILIIACQSFYRPEQLFLFRNIHFKCSQIVSILTNYTVFYFQAKKCNSCVRFHKFNLHTNFPEYIEHTCKIWEKLVQQFYVGRK